MEQETILSSISDANDGVLASPQARLIQTMLVNTMPLCNINQSYNTIVP